MIYTITPSPALDLSGTVENLIPNEKNYVTHEMRIAGGNGINAARIIHRLDSAVTATGFLGGPTGAEMRGLLDQEKINHQFVEIEGNTRVNLTVSNQSTHNQTRLSFPGPQISEDDIQKLSKYFTELSKPTLIAIGGSLPPGLSTKRLAEFINDLKSQGHLLIVDCPGSPMQELIKSKPFFIKPNLTEFQALTASTVSSMEDVLPLAKEMNQSVPLICISSVQGGALLVCEQGSWFGKISKITVKSTVGAGDSMVGGICHQLYQDQVYLKDQNQQQKYLEQRGGELLRAGLAASAATLSHPGITQGTKDDILEFLPQILIEQV